MYARTANAFFLPALELLKSIFHYRWFGCIRHDCSDSRYFPALELLSRYRAIVGLVASTTEARPASKSLGLSAVSNVCGTSLLL
jgi:hypothetical protein